jgi:hypothetical protein
MKTGKWYILVALIVAAILLLRNCGGSSSETIENVIVVDTVTTVVQDTVVISIEDRIDRAVTKTETKVEVMTEEMVTLKAEVIAYEQGLKQIVYDTVEVEVEPDSVMIYNVFEYAKTYGEETYIHRDTIQSRKVSREYVQKYIIK